MEGWIDLLTPFQKNPVHDHPSDVGTIEEPSSLLQVKASPNPFRETSLITFSLPKEGDATVEVVDSAGRLVRTVAKRAYPAGRWTLVWDGANEQGTKVSPGVYFVRLQAGGVEATHKVTLLP